MEKLKDHWETVKVGLAAAIPWATAEHLDLVLRLIGSAGAAYYIWRKVFKNKD